MRGRFLAAVMILGVLALLPLVGCKQREGQNTSSGAQRRRGARGFRHDP